MVLTTYEHLCGCLSCQDLLSPRTLQQSLSQVPFTECYRSGSARGTNFFWFVSLRKIWESYTNCGQRPFCENEGGLLSTCTIQYHSGMAANSVAIGGVYVIAPVNRNKIIGYYIKSCIWFCGKNWSVLSGTSLTLTGQPYGRMGIMSALTKLDVNNQRSWWRAAELLLHDNT